MLESCCVLRAQLGRVVLVYLQAHAGNSLSGMADACAQAAGEYRERHNTSECRYFQHSAAYPVWGCLCCHGTPGPGIANGAWAVYRLTPEA